MAITWAQIIAGVFASVKPSKEDKNNLKAEQLVHASHDEIILIDRYIAEISKTREIPKKDAKGTYDTLKKDLKKKLICYPYSDVDIALFGRMIASSQENTVEAAAQVAHPITIHPVVVEDDYFTAVDDLNKIEDNAGAGHVGTMEYGAGVFYTYVCINRERLIENLGGDEELANNAIKALVECVAMIGPKGKQASFGSRVYASYMMVEQGNQQPRSLAAAFIDPKMYCDNYVLEGIEKLRDEKRRMDDVYGKCSDIVSEFSVPEGTGKLDDILKTIG